MSWQPKQATENEAKKVKWDIVPYTRGKVLDVCNVPFRTFPHFTTMGIKDRYTKTLWRPDILGDPTDLSQFATEGWDALFSAFVLNTVDTPWKVLKEWWRVVKTDGHMILYLPYKNLHPHVGVIGASKYHNLDMMPDDTIKIMEHLSGWDLLINEVRGDGDEYGFLQVFRKRKDHVQNHEWRKKRPKKTAAVVRYGGIGDCIQASSVLPLLKEQGYHITFHCHPDVHDWMKHNPYIDEFWVQDKEQVPSTELRDFWDHIKGKYDRWVNLSETVEVSLLAVEQGAMFWWPTKARHRTMNANYMEVTHDIAQVPHIYDCRFYPSSEEKRWAEKERDKIKGPAVLWVISGSGTHKIWPHMDSFLAALMLETDWKAVLVGDQACEVAIEPRWRDEPRVILKSNKWSIRQTLAFAPLADMVIGPETGILNSVSTLDMPKIVFLSHSSVENLTKHWKNTVSLTPEDCPCYPCHQLHYGSKYCTKHPETGIALCQVNIYPHVLWESFCKLIGMEKRIWPGERPLIIRSSAQLRERL